MITKLIQRGALLAIVLGWLPAALAQDSSGTSTNLNSIRLSPDIAEIAQMSKSGVSNSVIIAHMKLNPRMYDLSAQDVLNLDKLGIPTELVLAMIDHDAALARSTLARPAASAEAETSLTNATDTVSPKPAPARPRAYRRPEGVVVLPIPAPAGSRTNVTREGKRRWTSSTVIDKAPPAPKLELIPDSPGRDYIWIQGHWAWRNGRWTWDEGYWVQRPGPDIVWIDGFWARHGKGWIWMPGRWR